MTTWDKVRLYIGIIIVAGIILFSISKLFHKKNPFTVKFLVRTGIFSALSIILYVVPYLKFPVPFFPSFLEIHFDEVPAFIAGFAYGPFSAFFIIVIKTIAKLPMSTSLGVGELTDFLYSTIFVVSASDLYNKRRNFKSALISLSIGTIFQVVVACFFTTFVILNFYMFVMGLSQETILKMCQVINPRITSLTWPFFFMIALPFNLFKDALVLILTILLYKRLHRFIDKIGQEKN